MMTTTGPDAISGVLRVATRGSALALAQSELVARGLRAAWPGLAVELVAVLTEGDRRRDVTTAELGGKGVFTGGVQQAVLSGRTHAAVHSAKDLPSLQVPGMVLAAVPEREDPRDVLVAARGGQVAIGCALDDLPEGAQVGTGSPRRAALLGYLRPDLKVSPLRGNVDSRLRRVREGDLDAVVLAVAGLRRLGLELDGDPLDPAVFVPAPGQGALAVEARDGDAETLDLLAAVTHDLSSRALRGERAFLARLGGSCTLPAGAQFGEGGDWTVRRLRGSSVEGGRSIARMHGFLAAEDGTGFVAAQVDGVAADPEALGVALAERLLEAAGPDVRALIEASEA
jgi:hydroxymethylbilane synthase